jgi:hypothetical protein
MYIRNMFMHYLQETQNTYFTENYVRPSTCLLITLLNGFLLNYILKGQTQYMAGLCIHL